MRLGPGACLLILGLLTHDTFAQSSPADDAEAYVRRGLELRRSGDDGAALAEFEHAQTLAPTPRIRAQIGLALQALGRWREAEEADLHVLSDGSDPWVRDHSDLLHESLATAQRHLSWISVDCNVAGAELLVNGTPAATLPLSTPVRVVAGAVMLQVQKSGYESVVRRIDVSAGTRARESVVLIQSPAALPIAARTTVPAPDPHIVRRTAGWATLASGGVLLGGGVVASIVSALSTGMYNDDSRCLIWPLTRDQRCGVERGIAETTRITAVITFAGGGLGVGAGALLLAMSGTRHIGSGAAAMACGVGAVSLACSGSF